MRRYKIRITELIYYDTFEVIANTLDHAKDIALDKINEGQIQIDNVEIAHYSITNDGESEEQNPNEED